VRAPGRESRGSGSELSEQEIQVRVATVDIGVWLTVIVSVGAGIYAFATWGGPNREAIVTVAALGLMSAPMVRFLPIERIVRGSWRERFFFCWSSLDILFIATVTALDGGTRSPYTLLFVLPFLFGALSYPMRVTAAVGAVDMVAFVAVAALAGGGFAHSAMAVFALFCVAVLSSWEARNQAARRLHLTETADALKASEQTIRQQARQQQGVASFGQLALEGSDISHLQSEAAELLRRVLGIEIVGVLKLDASANEFEVVAHVGIPPELRNARIPAGFESHPGFTLATGAPVVVEDWDEETRFGKSPLAAQAGAKSAAAVPIAGEGTTWGVLGGFTREKVSFTPEDISFMQAMANVLANAIERREEEERTRHEALHDPLTGLPNRTLFFDRLEHALAQAKRRNVSVAVLFCDLDQFKLVNDSLGHAAGDELLASVAPRLEQVLRPGDTVARFGGDEFAVLAEDVAIERDATRVAERIGEALTRPFIVRRREHFVSASIGIAISGGGDDPEGLIRDADAALYRAKERGRGGYEIFDEVMRARVIDHMQTENDLRRALQRKELELHYQPIVRMRDRAIVSMEALLRWNHPERGLVGPLAFIPVAEESRLILPIGRWVLEEACRRAAAWQARRPDSAPIGVAVNLSARQLADPQLERYVTEALDESGIEPASLRLELTESTLLEDTEALERTLRGLKKLGVGLVLDDFGVGFSSLGYLKRLPLSAIKLDRSFVENLAEGSQDVAIVRAVTDMAEALDMGVVAEGVETEQQLRAIEELGCGFVQGFHFSRPVPTDKVEDLLSAPDWAPALLEAARDRRDST
jgi:diguanylate cyclase (GGDEF)-like protein